MVLAHGTARVLGARRVVLGHVDHAVRPTSAKDADRVRAFGRALGTRVEVTRLEPGPDSEARLRQARYTALEAQSETLGVRCLLVAHTLEDQAETILLKLLRTTDPACFLGMPQARGALLRPFLGVSRREVGRYARRYGLQPIEDPTNLEPRYLRNRIRKELLPLIESRYRPGFARRLVEAPGRTERRPLTARAETTESTEPVQGLEDSPIEGRKSARFGRVAEEGSSLPPWCVRFERISWSGGTIPRGRDCAVFDAELLEVPAIRHYRPGDRIQPFGMLGARKVADVLREGGIPTDHRRFMPVVVDDEDRVIWVPGIVRGRTAPVTDSTHTAWVFTVQSESLQGARVRAKVQSNAQDASESGDLSSAGASKGRKR